MSNSIIVDTKYFEDVDLNTPNIKHPLIEKLQANHQAYLAEQQKNQQDKAEILNFLDDDVQEAIRHHNTQEHRLRVNAVLRALFATA